MENKITGIKRIFRDRMFWFCMMVAVLTLAICTKSSFLYPLNDWVDANCFYTVGKSIVHGNVLYRDIYEQKGPLLYFLHSIGYVICPDSFLGVYLLEVFAATVFLYCTSRMLSSYGWQIQIFVIPVLAVLVYSSTSFWFGDSAEEYCVPLFACCMLVADRWLKEDWDIDWRGGFLVGASGAAVFWIKYTMTGFFAGWIIVPAMKALIHKDRDQIRSLILGIVSGIVVVSVPVLLYFVVHGALDDLWQVYFYNNMFLYPDVEISETCSLFEKIEIVIITIYDSVKRTFKWNMQYSLLTVIGVLWILLKERWELKFHIICVMFFTCLTVYGGGRGYLYYGFILAVFSGFGMIPVCRFLSLFRKESDGSRRIVAGGSIWCICCLCMAFYFSDNIYLMNYKKEDMPQYRFAETICEKENATLLNYGFLDGGFYTASGVVPNCRFFCNLNIPLPDIMETQQRYVKEGLVDFVVTKEERLNAENYECIDSASMYLTGEEYTYYLYQKRTGE